MLSKKILFIGGGNMAEGIIKGLLKTETSKKESIMVSEILSDRRAYLKETYEIIVAEKPDLLMEQADLIFLAVRPQDAEYVADSMKDKMTASQILVSICAGITLDKMLGWFGADKKIARVMPNTLIESQNGYSGVCISASVNEENQATISKLFEALGQTMFIPENLFDEFTAYSCAGPAYIMYFIAAMIDAGVEAGFSRKDATAITLKNFIGSAQVLEQTGSHPYQITDNMTSPAGVTINGLHVLSKSGFHGIVMDAVESAVNRAKELR